MPHDHSHEDVQEEQVHFANVITTFRNYATYSVCTQQSSLDVHFSNALNKSGSRES